MAKLKLNLKGNWKQLLLQHGEKAGLALVGLLFVLLVWSAVGREGLPDSQQPEDLISLAERARNHLTIAKWDEFPDRPEEPPIGPQSIMKEIPLDPYLTRAVYDPPLFPRKLKRADPEMLAPIELEVHGGFGPFALHDPEANQRLGMGGEGRGMGPGGMPLGGPLGEGGLFGGTGPGGTTGMIGEEMLGGELDPSEPMPRPLPQWIDNYIGGVRPSANDKIEGRRWVVLNALVPVAKQIQEFERTFQDAEGYDPQADLPVYFAYQVERAEVRPDGRLDWRSLATVTPSYIANVTKDWNANAGMTNMREVAEERYLHPNLTFPLGPLVMRDWGDFAKHSKVPRAPTEEELRQMMDEGQMLEDEFARDDGQNDLFDQLNADPFMQGGGEMGEGGPRMNRGSRMRGNMGTPRGRAPGMGMAAGGRRGMMGREGSMMEKPAPHFLLRYFDFAIEPGKRYRYRVRLVMRDPNFHRAPSSAMGGGMGSSEQVRPIPVKYLERTVVERINATEPRMRPYRFTEWSEPSMIVEAPMEQNVLAAGVSAPGSGRFNDRPSAQILVKAFDQETGTEVAAERSLMRGSTIQFVADVDAIDLAQRQLIKVKEFSMAVNATLLDIRGGERLSSKDAELTEPGELLFLDAYGNLRVYNETSDRLNVLVHRELVKEEKPLENELEMQGEMYPDGAMGEEGGGRRRGNRTRQPRNRPMGP